MVERLKYLFFNVANDWQIGIGKISAEQFIQNDFTLPKIKWIKCSFDVFQADPFGIEINNNLFIFYEEFLKEKKYGIIRCMQLDEKLQILNDDVIIDDGIHKSFPYIIKLGNKYFMTPENSDENAQFIYECIGFPLHWQKKELLLDESVSDLIILSKDDSFQILYTKAINSNENRDLYMKSNKILFQSWNEIEEIKIKSDISNSRNAGEIIEVKGKLYRFAQNCEFRYGQSVKINLINKINNSLLDEENIGEISNLKYGIHTINFTKNYILIDRQIVRLKLKSIKEIYWTINKYFLKKS